jgi:hypothetical protein
VGRRIYTLEVKFNNSEVLSDKIKNTTGIPPGQVIIILFSILPRCKYLAF